MLRPISPNWVGDDWWISLNRLFYQLFGDDFNSYYTWIPSFALPPRFPSFAPADTVQSKLSTPWPPGTWQIRGASLKIGTSYVAEDSNRNTNSVTNQTLKPTTPRRNLAYLAYLSWADPILQEIATFSDQTSDSETWPCPKVTRQEASLEWWCWFELVPGSW